METMMDSSMDDRDDSVLEDLPSEESYFQEEHHDLSNNSFESGIDETEFKTTREESAKLLIRNSAEECTSVSFQDVINNLSAKKIARTSLLSQVALDPDSKLLQLKEDRTNIRPKYGYDSARKAYLFPEEALYLLDLGKIEIYLGHVSLSLQRARSLLLVPQREEGEDKLTNCTLAEYLVYKHLTRSGYSLYRFNKPGASEAPMTEHVEDRGDVEMEEDDDIIEVNSPNKQDHQGRQGLKRKCPPSSGSENDELDYINDETMDDYDHTKFWGGSSNVNPVPGTSSGGYMVDEADSDIEIVDEVINSHGGVEIQEISHSIGCQEDSNEEEPVPSTSKGLGPSQVVVDLVSSDEEEEELSIFTKRVWSKFIPNSKVIFKFPPPSLLPEAISASDKIYELDLKDKSDVSDLELEFLVDEVSLNDEDHGPSSSFAKSWKEWRQNMFQEARNVMNDSLLATIDHINGETAAEKLSLWSEALNETKPVLNKIVFEMYRTGGLGFSRLKLADEKPLYYVMITRQNETLPELSMFNSSVDGVPILIAVVCDNGDNEVAFMTTDRSPLNSLF